MGSSFASFVVTGGEPLVGPVLADVFVEDVAVLEDVVGVVADVGSVVGVVGVACIDVEDSTLVVVCL